MKKLLFIGYAASVVFTCQAQDSPIHLKSLDPAKMYSIHVSGSEDSSAKVQITGIDSAVKAHVDSAVSVAAPSDTKVGPIKLPTWLLTLIGGIPTFLIFAQFILKRIPTANSIKIQGWLGIVLDAVTFFQKDKSTTVSPSAPPPVQNGIEKPTLRDLANHK